MTSLSNVCIYVFSYIFNKYMYRIIILLIFFYKCSISWLFGFVMILALSFYESVSCRKNISTYLYINICITFCINICILHKKFLCRMLTIVISFLLNIIFSVISELCGTFWLQLPSILHFYFFIFTQMLKWVFLIKICPLYVAVGVGVGVVVNFKHFHLSPRTTGLISTKLNTKHKCVTGIHVCLNEGNIFKGKIVKNY